MSRRPWRRSAGRRGVACALRPTLGAVSCALVCSTLALGVSAARADTPPSSWDVARDPSVRDRWALHVRVAPLLIPVEDDREYELRLTAARNLLENADAAHSPDVRLRFDLGIVYDRLAGLSKRNDLERKAIDVLEPALKIAPDHPASADAFESLACAYDRLDRPHDEVGAWREYIAHTAEARTRIHAMMNMGEAEMQIGQLDDALATFREALQLCETLPNSGVNESYALTLWDLALALDRSGDPAASLSTAAKARTWTWTVPVVRGLMQGNETITGWDAIRDYRTVYFIPDWEREWYLALGFASAACTASDPHDAARMWAKAEQHWAEYVARASASAGQHDRWLPIARARLAHAHAARAEAENRAARLPARTVTVGEIWPDD